MKTAKKSLTNYVRLLEKENDKLRDEYNSLITICELFYSSAHSLLDDTTDYKAWDCITEACKRWEAETPEDA